MPNSTPRSWHEKRTFYGKPGIVRSYETQRFGGASGQHVSQRELGLVLALLPPGGPVLDLACGTGRVSRALRARGVQTVGLDVSLEMARTAHAASRAPTVLGDAFRLPFCDQAFAAVIALRLAFHYLELAPLVHEMTRVVRPGGVLIFDTCTYSPRALVPLRPGRWGGRVWAHPPATVRAIAGTLSLRVAHEHACFLGSPYLYRLAPLWLARLAEAVEPRLPAGLLCRRYWQLLRTA